MEKQRFLLNRDFQQNCEKSLNVLPKIIQKTYQKPCRNEVRTSEKSMPKTMLFSTSIFSVSASILEGLGPPTWRQVGSKSGCLVKRKPPPIDVKLKVLWKWRLGGLRTRFWRLRAWILEGLSWPSGCLLGVCWRHQPGKRLFPKVSVPKGSPLTFLPKKQAQLHGSPQTFLPPEGEAAVVPQGGVLWN